MNTVAVTLPLLGHAFDVFLSFLFPVARARRRLGQAVPAESRVTLAHRETHWLHATPGMEVTCVSGNLWLTFDNQLRDIVLGQGESHRCDCRARLGISALEAAELVIG